MGGHLMTTHQYSSSSKCSIRTVAGILDSIKTRAKIIFGIVTRIAIRKTKSPNDKKSKKKKKNGV
jgi:hypothetical protein